MSIEFETCVPQEDCPNTGAIAGCAIAGCAIAGTGNAGPCDELGLTNWGCDDE